MMTLVLFFIAGILNCIMDTLQFWHGRSIFRKLPSQSFFGVNNWMRKYKTRNRLLMDWVPKFPGSTTIFVHFMDGWHLSKFLMALCFIASIWIGSPKQLGPWWEYTIFILAHFTVFGMGFELTKLLIVNDKYDNEK